MIIGSVDYARLAALAEKIETTIAALQDPGALQNACNAGLNDPDFMTRRAWRDVAPAAAERRFGDCKEVNELLLLATLANPSQPQDPQT